MNQNETIADAVVIGAGLTGLTTAYFLKQRGFQVLVLEEQNRVGGQIQTHHEADFLFESGPNTGVVSYPEVAELFQSLSPACVLETARDEAKKRMIWKGGCFHALPSGPLSALTTPLFRWHDKLRILGEPWRSRGTDPDESIASLAARRLGKSFVDYAVDPFLSGVYAGDPHRLVTRYALPKLYRLEQDHGSFIRGTLAKARMPRTERDRLATKKVFSANQGLSALIGAMSESLSGQVETGVQHIRLRPSSDGQTHWQITATRNGESLAYATRHVVTTVGGYRLPELLPFLDARQTDVLNNLTYAPVMQVAVGYRQEPLPHFQVFGGLVPSCERRDLLGILNPSACFGERAPQGGNLLAVFMGGVRRGELLGCSDLQIEKLIEQNMRQMLGITVSPDLIRIFRHERAIPQYEKNSGARFEMIRQLEEQYPGLHLKGNICGGIGMADRIRQAYLTAEQI